MLGLSVVSSSNIDSALQLINAISNAGAAKQVLEELRAEIDRLNKARDEATVERQRAEAATAEAEKATAALADARAALVQREATVTAREQQAERVRALTRERLAGMEA